MSPVTVVFSAITLFFPLAVPEVPPLSALTSVPPSTSPGLNAR